MALVDLARRRRRDEDRRRVSLTMTLENFSNISRIVASIDVLISLIF